VREVLPDPSTMKILTHIYWQLSESKIARLGSQRVGTLKVGAKQRSGLLQDKKKKRVGQAEKMYIVTGKGVTLVIS